YRARPLERLQSRLNEPVSGLVPLPGGNLLVALANGQLHLWDLAARRPLTVSTSLYELCNASGNWSGAAYDNQFWLCGTELTTKPQDRYRFFFGTCSAEAIQLQHREVPHAIRSVALGGKPWSVAVSTDEGIYFLPLAPVPDEIPQ